MKKSVVRTGLILLAAGLVLFAAALAITGFDFSKLASEKIETRTCPVEETFARIEIDTKETDVLIQPSPDGSCSVVCEERDKVRHSVSVEDGTLKILADDQRGWLDHLTLFSKPKKMTLYLPVGHYDALTIGCGTGDVTIPEGYSFGSAVVTASTGNIRVVGVTVNELTLSASTGDIRLEESRANKTSLTVSTGDISVNAVTCEKYILTRIDTGDADISDLTCRTFTAKGNTGHITLRDVTASGRLSVKRSTGDVTFENCDAETISVKTTTGNVTGTLRTEKVFLTETSTGKIDVPKTSAGGSCEITTSTGDIRIGIAGAAEG